MRELARVPDVAVSSHKPRRSYPLGQPPELVIEILSTRRGNVERTEKIRLDRPVSRAAS